MTMGMLFCGESGICGTLSVDGGTRWREMVVEREVVSAWSGRRGSTTVPASYG